MANDRVKTPGNIFAEYFGKRVIFKHTRSNATYVGKVLELGGLWTFFEFEGGRKGWRDTRDHEVVACQD